MNKCEYCQPRKKSNFLFCNYFYYCFLNQKKKKLNKRKKKRYDKNADHLVYQLVNNNLNKKIYLKKKQT